MKIGSICKWNYVKGGGERETMKNMNYGGHPSKLTMFLYDIWSRNQMKVMHIRFHISKSLLKKLKILPKKLIRNLINKKIQNSKKMNRMGLANQLYKLHTKFHPASQLQRSQQSEGNKCRWRKARKKFLNPQKLQILRKTVLQISCTRYKKISSS